MANSNRSRKNRSNKNRKSKNSRKSRNTRKSRKIHKGGDRTLDQCLNDIKTFNIMNEYSKGFDCMSGGGSCKHITLGGPKLNKSSAYLSVPRREFEINMSGGSAPIQDRHWKVNIPGDNANSFSVMLGYATLPKLKLDTRWQELPFRFSSWSEASQYLHKHYPSLKAKIVPSLETPTMNLRAREENSNQLNQFKQALGRSVNNEKSGGTIPEDNYIAESLQKLNENLLKNDKTLDRDNLEKNEKYRELHDNIINKIKNLRDKKFNSKNITAL